LKIATAGKRSIFAIALPKAAGTLHDVKRTGIMKIELKNIKHSPSLSEETEAFTASLYIDGKCVGSVENHGHGGNTDYRANTREDRAIIEQAEAYCKGLPPEICHDIIIDGKPMVIEMKLEYYIDNLLFQHLKQKEAARLKKLEVNRILYGNFESGDVFSLKFKRPLAEILAHPNGDDILAKNIKEKILPELIEGMKVLNHNLPEPVYTKAGLQKHQYNTPEVHVPKQRSPKKKPGPKPGKGKGYR